MDLGLGKLEQVALAVDDVDAAEAFYEGVLGLRKLFRPTSNMVFFDLAGVRLMLGTPDSPDLRVGGSVLYLLCGDIAEACRELEGRGVAFTIPAHFTAAMPDHDLWMAFFKDPSGNLLALSSRAPRGYTLPG